MFKAIVHFSIQKKLFVGLTTLFLLLGGIYAMMTLPIDAVPDITHRYLDRHGDQLLYLLRGQGWRYRHDLHLIVRYIRYGIYR